MPKLASDNLLQAVRLQERYADSWARPVAAGAAGVGSGYSSNVQAAAEAVVAASRDLPALRRQALATHVSATQVIGEYDALVNALLAFDDQVAPRSTDPQLTSAVQSMGAIALEEDELGVQRAIVMYGLSAHYLSPVMRGQFTASMADQRADLAEFRDFATPNQAAMLGNSLAASREDRALSDEQFVLSNMNRLAGLPIVNTDWWGAITSAINATHRVDETLANSAVDRARVLRERAIISAVVIGGIILLVVLFSLLLSVFFWRSTADRPLNLDSAKRWHQPRRGDLGADGAGA